LAYYTKVRDILEGTVSRYL